MRMNKQVQKQVTFADKVGNAKMSERTSEIITIKAKLHDLLEEMGNWKEKYELMADDDFNEAVLCSVELEDLIDRWIIKSMDETMRSFGFSKF